ncbi:MAG TPA: hypothetical protein VFL04_08205 [Rectinemataceae bacterium]|nr:hypothetical protein [Rectinemataceae bacterium]
MTKTEDLGFCVLEFRQGFMVATIQPDSPIGEAQTLAVAGAKRGHYGEERVGLVLYNPWNSPIDPGIFAHAERLMEEQGYAFLIVARPNPSNSRMLELFNKHCLVYVGDSLEDAVAHAETVVRAASCT